MLDLVRENRRNPLPWELIRDAITGKDRNSQENPNLLLTNFSLWKSFYFQRLINQTQDGGNDVEDDEPDGINAGKL